MVAGSVRSNELRRPRLRTPAGRHRQAPKPLQTVEQVNLWAAGLAKQVAVARLDVELLDLVRVLTIPAENEARVERLVLRVEDWKAPTNRWSGRLGPLPGVLTYSVRYPDRGEGAAEVDIAFSSPALLSDAVRGVYPLLGVNRRHQGYGYPEVAVASGSVETLALLPTRTAPPVPSLPTPQLDGVGLSRTEVGLVATEEDYRTYLSTADDPEQTLVRHPVLVEPTGHLAVMERTQLPLVDLNVHNPIGRLQTSDRAPGSLIATLDSANLHFRPVPDDGPLEGFSVPLHRPLDARDVMRFRRAEAVDLSRIQTSDGLAEAALYRRLAEIAATGAILHSLSPLLRRAEDVLGVTLTGMARQPYSPSTGLPRDLRSVPQRREAMRRFGGFFELADYTSRTLGYRLLPTVSVVLSSMRPSRLEQVLQAMSQQSYPHLEVSLALHGYRGEISEGLAQSIKLCDASVARYDASLPFGSVLAEAARRSSGDLVIKVDDDDFYGPEFISDLVLAYLYSNADVVGKTTEFLYFEALNHTVHRRFITETFHYQLAGGSMMLSRAALNEIGGWRPSHNSTDRSILIRAGNAGLVGYRTQGLGYIYVRHTDGHTWNRTDSLLLTGEYEQWPRFLPEVLSV